MGSQLEGQGHHELLKSQPCHSRVATFKLKVKQKQVEGHCIQVSIHSRPLSLSQRLCFFSITCRTDLQTNFY